MECTRPHDTKNDKSSNIGVLKCTTAGAVAFLQSISGNKTSIDQSQSIEPLVEPSLKKEDDTSASRISEILPYLRPPNDKKRAIGYGAWTVLTFLVCCIVGTAIKLPTWLGQIMSRINSSGVDKEKETKPANLTVGSNVNPESSNSPKDENEVDQQGEEKKMRKISNESSSSQDSSDAESDINNISDVESSKKSMEEVEGDDKIKSDSTLTQQKSSNKSNVESIRQANLTVGSNVNPESSNSPKDENEVDQQGEEKKMRKISNEISQDAPGAESDKDSISTSENETNTSSSGDSPTLNGTQEEVEGEKNTSNEQDSSDANQNNEDQIVGSSQDGCDAVPNLLTLYCEKNPPKWSDEGWLIVQTRLDYLHKMHKIFDEVHVMRSGADYNHQRMSNLKTDLLKNMETAWSKLERLSNSSLTKIGSRIMLKDFVIHDIMIPVIDFCNKQQKHEVENGHTVDMDVLEKIFKQINDCLTKLCEVLKIDLAILSTSHEIFRKKDYFQDFYPHLAAIGLNYQCV